MGSGNVFKSALNLATLGATGQYDAQKNAMSQQQQAQQMALLQQQQAYEQQRIQNEQMKSYYDQQAKIQERDIANQEAQMEMQNKYNLSASKRQNTDKNSADLTKGAVSGSPVIKAELQGQDDLDQVVERWY